MFLNTVLFILIIYFNNCKLLSASSEFQQYVYCHQDFLSIKLPLTSNHSELFIESVYWQNLHLNSIKECQPLYQLNGIISFKILLKNLSKCGFLRNFNKCQHEVSFNQNLILQQSANATTKLNIKCLYKLKTTTLQRKHKLAKRATVDDDFPEDLDIEVIDSIEQKAPEPQISVTVKQNEELINDKVTVIPGTPLIMEVKLHENSNEIYGLNVNYLEVTDMAKMSETILFKGCTVDPYLFENFNFTQINSLKTKFRAFKFPNSAYVQFRLNVQVCLQKCKTNQCIGTSGGLHKRRRRESEYQEISTSLVLRFNETFKVNKEEFHNLQHHVNMLHTKNFKRFSALA